jgi:hypothetical protein
MSDGNYDMVGNNTPIFFVRDPMKFQHFIRSQKRRADNGLRDHDMQWDFWTLSPESAHIRSGDRVPNHRSRSTLRMCPFTATARAESGARSTSHSKNVDQDLGDRAEQVVAATVGA